MTILKNNDISVIIHTLNEENNIRNCLECVKWAEEIIIIDMYSDDKTLEIARQYTDKIFMHERLDTADLARQFGLEKVSKNWILVVDADEFISVQLCRALIDIVKSNQCDAVSFPCVNYFFGYRLSEIGYRYRFFRKGYAFWPAALHSLPQFLPGTRMLKLDNQDQAMIHFTYIDDEHYFKKLQRYTKLHAKGFHNAKSLPDYYKKIYDLTGSSPDGLIGTIYSTLTQLYLELSILKYLQMQEYGTDDIASCISKKYKDLAHAIIADYNNYE
jgi:glycosyltransferase involved in cell wall biosynthesis